MKKYLLLFLLILSLFITLPAMADDRYRVSSIDGLGADCISEKGKVIVILRWNAKVVDSTGNIGSVIGGTGVEIGRTEIENPNAYSYATIDKITPTQPSEGIMEWKDENVEVGKKYYYQVKTVDALINKFQTTSILVQPPPPGQVGQPGTQPGDTAKRNAEYYRIFTPERWETVMFWYNSLAILSGAFLVVVMIRSGYRYMLSAANPGLKASFVEELQRCIVAMMIIALAPVFIKVLIGINDGFVAFFANIINYMTTGAVAGQPASLGPAGMFETVIAAPFKIILSLIRNVFGLNSIDTIIFNGRVALLQNFSAPDTGNIFANVMLDLSLAGFDVYFNALYTIRKWVVTIAFTSTPIIVWIWALTAERQVLEIWLSEIFQTIFVQTAHALSLGVCLSILCAKTTSGIVDGAWLSNGIIKIALWVAGLGSAACVLIIVFVGYRILMADGEKEAAEAKSSLKKALIGLAILGLSLTIAGYLASLFSGKWY